MAGLAQSLKARLNVLKNNQTRWHKIWQDCARYCLPNASPLKVLTSKTEGEQKEQPLDISGIDSATKLSSWLYSSTVYQGEEWFSLEVRGDEKTYKPIDGKSYSSQYRIKQWLQKASQAVLDCINPSNFIQIYQQVLRGYSVFGTAVIYTEFNEKNELICKCWDITDSVYIAEDKNGEIDTVFREFEYTARQAVQAFGFDNLHVDIQKASQSPKEKDKKFKFAHCVYPREKQYTDKSKRLPKYKPIASVYIDVEHEKVVLNGGTDTFPYCVPRFYNTGEVYGRSPAMSAVPALRALNMTTYQYVENLRSASKPVVFGPTSMIDDVDLEAGAFNAYSSDDGQIVLWSATGDMRSALEFIERQRQDIRGIFYNDVFQYLEDRKNMTATEAQLRYDEMIQGISPVLANLQNDLFKRFIYRIVIHLCDCGIIHVPAEFLDENGKRQLPNFDIVYKSRLDTKIKGVQNADMLTFLRMLGEGVAIISQNPQLAARIDVDKFSQKIAENCNVAGLGLLLPEDKVAENLEAQAQQAQQAQLQNMVAPINLQDAPAQGSAMDTMLNM